MDIWVRRARALRERSDLDDELEQSRAESPEARIALSLELSELSRSAAESLGAAWIRVPPDDLAEKARLYARPLALIRGRAAR